MKFYFKPDYTGFWMAPPAPVDGLPAQPKPWPFDGAGYVIHPDGVVIRCIIMLGGGEIKFFDIQSNSIEPIATVQDRPDFKFTPANEECVARIMSNNALKLDKVGFTSAESAECTSHAMFFPVCITGYSHAEIKFYKYRLPL